MILRSERFKQSDVAHRDRVHSVYSTPDGMRELFLTVCHLGLFSQSTTPEDITMRNIAISKLEEVGLLDEDKLWEVFQYAMNLPIVLNERDKVELTDDGYFNS